MRIGHALALVANVGSERTRGELKLSLDELRLVTTLKKEPNNHVVKELIVKITQHLAHAVETAHE